VVAGGSMKGEERNGAKRNATELRQTAGAVAGCPHEEE